MPRHRRQLPRRHDHARVSTPTPTPPWASRHPVCIVETASQRKRFAVGDRVHGLFPDGTGTDRHHRRAAAAKVPAGWSDADAATAPVVFATAHYALSTWPTSSRVSGSWCTRPPVEWGWPRCSWPGIWGLEVFATASRGKWDTLRAMGFDEDHIARFAQPGVRGQVPCGHRQDRHGRDGCGAGLAGRRIRRRVAATGRPRRRIPRDGQDRHPRPR